MKRKQKIENYLMRIDNFVYDYKYDDSIEKVIVAYADNVDLYSIYYVFNNEITFAFTSMPDELIVNYIEDLNNNIDLILSIGRKEDYYAFV